MKNPVVISFFLLSVLAANAQDLEYQTKAEITQAEHEMNLDKQRMKDGRISSIKIYSYKSESEENSKLGYLSIERAYNTDGNITDFRVYTRHGKIKFHYTYIYDHNGREIEFNELKSNGIIRRKLTMTYDSSGNITDRRNYWKRSGNLRWHCITRYDDKQNMIELKYSGKNDQKDLGGFVYTYYPDGTKKQTVEYGRKKKVLHTWNYDCDPSGKSEGKNLKDTSNICIRYTTDKDGNKIKIKEENHKGSKIRRIISKYDAQNNLLDVMQYDKKERVRYHYHSAYDSKNNLTESLYYRDKSDEIKHRYVYHYDASGNLIELLTYKKSSLPDRILKYNYISQK